MLYEVITYLIAAVNRYLRRPITHDDIVASFSGVRLLLDQKGKAASAISRVITSYSIHYTKLYEIGGQLVASIWIELKRRNVIRVAVAYAVVGWLLIEA